MVRLHPNLMHRSHELTALYPNAINVSSYPDMQELLYAADLLLTDYSSSMFDYMYTYKPILLYMPDYDIYDRGYYFTLEELPFMLTYSNNEIRESIQTFDITNFRKKVQKFLNNIVSYEEGCASKNVLYYLQSSRDES